MIEPSLVVLAACLHAEESTCFDALSPKYIEFLENTFK